MGVRWKGAGTLSGDDSSRSRLCVSVASSVGVGVFLIVGYVAKHVAGPATLISIAIAAVIAVLSALCNIELSQRLPRKASPYTFSHVCLGRFASFLTGWTLILEYAVAIAVVSKGIGLYIDTLADDAMQLAFVEVAPLGAGKVFGTYFDFFGAVVVLTVGSLFVVDFQRRKWVDTGALVISVAVVIFIITAGSFNANPVNWTATDDGSGASADDDTDQTTPAAAPTSHRSGFFPFGVMATFRGAALCTFAFIGIEMLMRSKRDAQRSVSYVGMMSFAMIFLSLFGCTVVLTLMWPHYLMHVNVPFPYAFASHNFNLAKWIVSIAAIVILATSLWTLMFPLKRQILALAEDGLLPFAEHNRLALQATLLTAVTIASLFAGLFSTGQLIDLLSVGTLLMFIVVSVAIVLLRYSHQLEIGSISTMDVSELRAVDFATAPPLSGFTSTPTATSIFPFPLNGRHATASAQPPTSARTWLRQIVGRAATDDQPRCATRYFSGSGAAPTSQPPSGDQQRPTARSFYVVKCALAVQLAAMIGAALTVRYLEEHIYQLQVWAITVLAACVLLWTVCVLVTAVQPQRVNRNYYKVPLVAATASSTLFACVLLVGMLDYTAWVRFCIWLAIGVPVFVVARRRRRERKWRGTGGISKIQGMHNRGFVADNRAPAALAVQTAAQMVEITEVDETAEQMDTYAVPATAVRTAGTDGPGRTLDSPNDGNNNRANGALKIASRTPSPSSSLDDIQLASDIIESLCERREPNGKTYFVDDAASATVGAAGASISTATVDDVVQRKSEPAASDMSELPSVATDAMTSTIAVVHTQCKSDDDDDHDGDGDRVEEDDDIATNETLAAAETGEDFDYGAAQLQSLDSDSSDGEPMPGGKFFIHDDGDDEDDDNDDVGAISTQTERTFDLQPSSDISPDAEVSSATIAEKPTTDTNASDFKERLSAMLLGQTRMLGRQSSFVGASALANVRSASDVRHSNDGARFTVTDVVPATADDGVGATAAVAPNTGIPVPPLFIPDLYNGLSSAQPTRMPTPDYDDDDDNDDEEANRRVPSDQTNQPDHQPAERVDAHPSPDSANVNTPANNHNSGDVSDEPSADELKIAIRAKLENILSRGPPVRVSQTLSAAGLADRLSNVPVVVDTAAPVETLAVAATQSPPADIDNVEVVVDEPVVVVSPSPEEVVRMTPAMTETQHRALFKNVLKSINTDGSRDAGDVATRPAAATRRTLSAKPATIEDARKSLRHVENVML